MADTPQTASLVVTANAYAGDIVSIINREAVMLRTLPIKTCESTYPSWAVKGDGSVAEYHSETAVATNFGSDQQLEAKLDHALLWAPFHSSDLSRAQAARSTTPGGNQDLWSSNLVDASGELASMINKQGHIGAGTGSNKQIAGLTTAIGSATGTYAALDRSVVPAFAPSVFDPSQPTPVVKSMIRSDLAQIKKKGGAKPDIAYAGTSTYQALAADFDGDRYYVQDITTARGSFTLDASVSALRYDGCTIIEDKDCEEGVIKYVSSREVWWDVLPAVMPKGMPAIDIRANDGYGSVPLAFYYKKLASGGASERALVGAMIQLVVRRPNRCGIRKNVAY